MSPEALTAAEAGLRYVTDARPGITRRVRRGSFVFFSPAGVKLSDEAELARIRKLAIPPAYTDVWICPHPDGHIQATGRDARGRKQYRYHARWREHRDATKYHRMLDFGRALPRLRQRVEAGLAAEAVSRERILATLLRLLDTTLIRVGNEEYARQNRSYGLTTLRTRHVEVQGSTVRFHFRGKSGVEHEVEVSDRRVARAIAGCLELPGQELFQYVDADGARHNVSSEDVNAYLRELSGEEFTAKDYRTWAGSVIALATLRGRTAESEREAKQHVVETVKVVAARLRNTPAVCRKCYIHPAVLDRFLTERAVTTAGVRARRGLDREEVALLRFLEDSARPGLVTGARAVRRRTAQPVKLAA